MNHLLTFSLRYRFFTLVAIAVVIATGIWSFTNLTIDAVPDLTPVQVQVLTRAPASVSYTHLQAREAAVGPSAVCAS